MGPTDYNEKPLSDVEAKFVEHYVVDLNATRAYREAVKATGGELPADGGRSQGWRVRRRPHVRARIDGILRERGEALDVTVDTIVEDLQRNYISAYERGDLSAANKAVELKGKTAGLFKDKVDVTGTMSFTALVEAAAADDDDDGRDKLTDEYVERADDGEEDL